MNARFLAGASPEERALREAAEWFACLADASHASAAGAAEREEERRRWQAWLAEHPANASAWRRVEAVAQRLVPVANKGPAARRALEVRLPSRRRALKALGIFALSAGGALSLARLPWRDWEHAYSAGHAAHRSLPGQTQAFALADGGRVWIGSSSALDAEYSASFRRLRLYAGDLLVETAHDNRDPARPFVVDTPHGRMRALGTRFAVRVGADSSRIDVFEGAVQVAPAGAAPSRLDAGRYALFDRNAILATGAAQAGREAWARGLLVADGMRLDELLAEMMRWDAQPLTCDADVADLRVVGSFRLRDPEQTLAVLQQSLPVVALREGNAIRLARRAAPPVQIPGGFEPPRRAP